MDNTWCNSQNDGEYLSLLEAKKSCSPDEDCGMFYDVESKNENYVLCTKFSVTKPSTFFGSSRLYMKCKNILTTYLTLIN